ncbi:hypothetical protein MPH_11025 [Macrophomina phaseolina MS6]|uniref:Uncharacterized protein n=2 Tax=Macrophomina phaseolina TaxID=35725 RepID=K2RFB0_MACPH|nr:hypothetical protein MPH_11025 [Macrophomina phaseolina MS6]KAH7057376.1 hypothetical protein B0J12DRAFT_709273 [Macrophomina phaseolina]
MAAPQGINILNMTGSWTLNRSLSDDLDATFALQGIPWIVRTIINYASLEIKMRQQPPSPPERPTAVIDINQIVRPGGFDTANSYILDGETREDTVPIFGTIAMHCSYVKAADVADEDSFGASVERPLSDDERIGIMEISEGVHTGWFTTTLWAFETVDGERRFCKYCTTTKDDQKVQARLVYDYSPIDAE